MGVGNNKLAPMKGDGNRSCLGLRGVHRPFDPPNKGLSNGRYLVDLSQNLPSKS